MATKVTLGLSALVGLGAVISITTTAHLTKEFVMDGANQELSNSLSSLVDGFHDDIKAPKGDLALIKQDKLVGDLLKALAESPSSDDRQEVIQESINGLEKTFATLVREKGYLQVRLIGLGDGGRELVRVDKTRDSDTGVTVVRGERLQQKGNRTYFQAGLNLSPDQYHVSDITLNRENGIIQSPWLPTQRIVAPVYLDDEVGQPAALVVINTDATILIEHFAANSRVKMYLVNQDGGIIHHPESNLEWRFEFNPEAGLAQVAPMAWGLLQQNRQVTHMEDERGQLHISARIFLNTEEDRYLGVVLCPDEKSLLAGSRDMVKRLVSVGPVVLFCALILGSVLTKRLLRPMANLTRQVAELKSGERQVLELDHRQDETGRLGLAFEELVTQLQERTRESDQRSQEVIELNDTLEEKVVSRTNELKAIQHKLSRDVARRNALNQMLHLSLDSHDPAELLSGALDLLLELDFLTIENQGAAFVVENNLKPELVMMVSRNMADPLQDQCARVPFGKCLCGQAAETGQILFRSCVDDDHHTTFEGMAPHGHYNVPLVSGFKVLGLLALYLPHGAKRQEVDVEFLVSVADILGAGLSRMNIEADLRESQATTEMAMVELEEARSSAVAASESKSAFLANMSHEIRTPMTAILGYTDLLAEPDNNQESRLEHLNTIKQNGKHLLTIINDILDVSKIESGRMEMEELNISPWDIAGEVIDLMAVRAKDKGIKLFADFKYPLPQTICSDPVRVRQVLLNLVGNSIKFTSEGQVRLEVSLVQHEKGPRMRFAVSDTGIGMSREQMDRLFTPFSQADASTTRKFGGTGLGLTISKRLSEMMGGGISLESAPGHGSIFTVEIDPGELSGVPLLDSAPSMEKTDSDGSADAKWAPTLSGRILLAEDTLVNQRLAIRLLTKAGHQVEAVGNGKEALDGALEQLEAGTPFDIILMDVQMPVMDGLEATRLLRESGYERPIVALTANAMASDREICMQAGCDDFSTKPFNKIKLLQTLEQWLKKSPVSTA